MTIYNDFKYLNNEDQFYFLNNGYIISKVENTAGLDFFKKFILNETRQILSINESIPDLEILNNLSKLININDLNEYRMLVHSKLNSLSWVRPTFISFARNIIDQIIGLEIAVQKKINFNVMPPNIEGSNIPLHSDSHSGESLYQCVLWLPLSDCFLTKSIFILPKKITSELNLNLLTLMENSGYDEILNKYKEHLIWLNIPYGYFVLFSSNLYHGSVINETGQTRWSLNLRIKSLFSPYSSVDKSILNFYNAENILPATKWGLDYEVPKGLIEV